MELNRFSCEGMGITSLGMVMGNDSSIASFGFKEPEVKAASPSVSATFTPKLGMGN